MDVIRYRVTARRSHFVFSPEDSIEDLSDEKARGRAKTAADSEGKSRLDYYRELAAQGKPIARYR